MESAQRQELESMRDRLVERMNVLEDQERYGTISAEERDKLLVDEFGADYHSTLRQINTLLTTEPDTPKRASKTLIASVFSILAFGIAFSALFAFTPTAFMVLGTETALEPNLLLQIDQAELLDLPAETVIVSLSLTEETTLILEDAYRQLTLYENGRCVGCGQRIHEPYLLTNTGETHTTITRIGVLQE